MFYRPYRGGVHFVPYPRLTPWATLERRSAAEGPDNAMNFRKALGLTRTVDARAGRNDKRFGG